MRQSNYEVICPHCGAGYNLSTGLLPTLQMRCAQCRMVFKMSLETTGSYGCYRSSSSKKSVSSGPTEYSPHSLPPGKRAPTLREMKLKEMKAQVDAVKEKYGLKGVNQHNRNPERPRLSALSNRIFNDSWTTTPPSPSSSSASREKNSLRITADNGKADLKSTTPSWGYISEFFNRAADHDKPGHGENDSPPPTWHSRVFVKGKSKTSCTTAKVTKATPLSTEIRDSFLSGFPKIPLKPKSKKEFLIPIALVVISLSLIVPTIVFHRVSTLTEMPAEESHTTQLAKIPPMFSANWISMSVWEPGLHATVGGSNKGFAKDHAPILIVSGTVSNSSYDDKSGIIVEGKILDGEGNVLLEASVPCGVLHRHSLLQNTPPESIGALYSREGKPFDCSLTRGGTKKYQLVFNQIPAGSSEDIFISVRALASTEARSGKAS